MRLRAKVTSAKVMLAAAVTILLVGGVLSPVPTARPGTLPAVPGLQELTDIEGAEHPTISDDGRLIAFVSQRTGTWDVYVYDRSTRRLSRPDLLAGSGHPIDAALSGDGQFLVAVRNDRPHNPSRPDTWSLVLYDRAHAKLLPLPGLSIRGEPWMPAISGNGRFIAFVEAPRESDINLYDRFTKRHVEFRHDIRLYDRWSRAMVPLPRLYREFPNGFWPSVDNKGRYIAFEWFAGSSHPRQMRLHVYDRQQDRFIELPGLNEQECTESGRLSGDGRLLVYMSYANQAPSHCYSRDPGQIRLYDTSRKVQVALPVDLRAYPGRPAISSNGRFIVFTTNVLRTYVYDRQG